MNENGVPSPRHHQRFDVAPAVVRVLNALVLIIDAVLIHGRPDGKAVHDFAGRTVVVRG
ncbi:MAG: hypothetical protein IMX05_09865 [Hydrogenibacillus schlegelii]|nr:hypothetical protein [Hydrogenibacillus schlegelii]